MKYVCLIYQDEKILEQISDAELDQIMSECDAWVEEQEVRLIACSALQSVRTSVTLRKRNGQLNVVDGPFAETKEVLGGFAVIDARDLSEAVHLASRCPAARIGSVEVRPVLDNSVRATDPLDRKLADSMRRTAHIAIGD